MTPQRLSNILIYTAAGLLIVTGVIHLSQLSAIASLARDTNSPDMQALLPMFWVAIGVNFVVAGVMVGLVGIENSSGGRYVLAAAALVPWSGALLQILYVGVIPPTYLLLLDGGVVLAAAYYRESRRRRTQA